MQHTPHTKMYKYTKNCIIIHRLATGGGTHKRKERKAWKEIKEINNNIYILYNRGKQKKKEKVWKRKKKT